MTVAVSFAAGLLFGLGLIVAGMTDPGKVQGFLDLAGVWDPSLGFVMAGAIAVGLAGFAVARRRARSLLGLPMHLPAATGIDRRLLAGAALFGIGWGLAGICPGPAVVLMGAGVAKAWVFGLAMVAGMGLFAWVQRRSGH